MHTWWWSRYGHDQEGEGGGPSGIPPAEGELSFATRRVKFEGAKREGASKEETVAAAFEAIYDSSPRWRPAFEKAREAHRTVEERIAMATPAPIDASESITQLEAKETLALEDLDAEEEAALEQSLQEQAAFSIRLEGVAYRGTSPRV
jgi:hypothetical protein